MIIARNARQVKEWMQGVSSQPVPAPLERGQKGLLTGTLNLYLNGDDNRYLVLGWLFNDAHNGAPMSSKELDEGQWMALWQWIDPYKEDNQYAYAPTFPLESAIVLTVAIKHWEDVMLKVPLIDRGDIEPGEMLRTAVFYEGGVITAVLDEDGQPITSGDDVRAYSEEQPKLLGFLDKAIKKGEQNGR